MALLTHVASRPSQLVSGLCEQLAAPPDDLFTPEVVAVPTRGIERWLTQRIASDLARRGASDGICANIEFPSPRQLIRAVLIEVPELAASARAWEGATLAGHAVNAIDSNLSQPWMRLLARYLEPADGELISQNRLWAAQKVARLFTTYGRRRPGMIRAWAVGTDTGPNGDVLPDGYLWQPRLWRAVRDRVGVPAPAELLPGALEPIREGAIQLDLPARIAVYGLTATDPFDLEMLVALSAQRDVHLYVLHPSPALWDTTARELNSGPSPIPVPARDDDTTEYLATHPLLKAWARDSRELQTVLASHELAGSLTDDSEEVAHTVLGRLQDEIRHNREPTSDAQLEANVEAGDDRSLQIHVCHGARRQVEVLRDAILHVLVANPALEARDVVIMTPDLGTFAPLLEAAFPSGNASLPDLRVRIADRSPAVTNPLVRFAATLLQLAGGRLEAGAIRELVARPVVQQRFDFDTETAGQIVGVLDDANISWGLDSADRRASGAGGNDERTWARGLDRALAGVFYSDSALRVVAGTVPMNGVEGHEGTPVGLLAQIIDRIAAIRTVLAQPRPMSQWSRALSSSVRLLAAPAWGEDWQMDQLEHLLRETFPAPELHADPDAIDQVVSLPEARMAMAGWTEDRPSALHFRTGNVTVSTLAPMRSVPYPVVCLLGMDEQRFPRRGRADGDDLLLGHEQVGDHDRSAEDRELLLDAVLAAEQHLILTYSGRNEMTNADLPPAVPVAELQDVLSEMLGAQGHLHLTTTHPLQAFSEDNFIPGALRVAGPWAFDGMQLDGALAVQGNALDSPPADASWPVWDQPERLRLDDLIAFLQNPSKRFVRSRLGFSIPTAGEMPDDTVPAQLNPLAKWGVTDRLLTGLVEGHELAALEDRERSSDALPPGDLSTEDLDEAIDTANSLWGAATVRGYNPAENVVVSGLLEVGGQLIEGSVLANPRQAHVVTLTPSRLKAKQRLEAFVRLVFVSLMQPDTAWSALIIGKWARKRGKRDGHTLVSIGPIGADSTARRQQSYELLGRLIALYNQGHAEPVPMPCETSYAWQNSLAEGRDKAFAAATEKWEKAKFAPEAEDPAHEMLLPGVASTKDLVAAGLDTFAEELWAPILPLLEETDL
ncbi:MAG: exodeoxyribonuclease V subunit gamma [Acidimicrobiales bacterium]